MEETTIKHYQNDPELFDDFKNRYLMRSILIMLIFLPSFLFIQYYGDQAKTSTIEPKMPFSQYIIIGVGITLFYTFMLFRSIGLLRTQFNSLSISLGDGEIISEQLRQKFQLLHLSEISLVKVYENNTIVIKDHDKKKIIVSKYLKGHNDFLKQIEAQNIPVQQNKTPLIEKYSLIFGVVFSTASLLMLYSFLINKEKSIIILGLSFFELVCGFALIESIRNGDRTNKQYIFIIFYLFLMLIFGITGCIGIGNM